MKKFLGRYIHCETCIACSLLSLVTILTYAPFINQLGFYQEDWLNIWSGLTQGPKSFIPLFASDRPLIGYQFALLYPILGNSPLPWHLFALILRLLTVFSLFWLLRMIWPDKLFETTAATLLFAVYPGFLQQPQALTFQVHLLALLLAIVSIALSIRALRETNVIKIIALTAVSIFFMLTYLMFIEYSIGLEILRVILIWYVLQQKQQLPIKKSFIPAIKWWLPYFLSSGIYLFWRLFIYKSTRATTNVDFLLGEYTSQNYHMALRLIIETVRSFFETVFLAWGVPLYKNFFYGSYKDILLALAPAFLAVASLILYYVLFKPAKPINGASRDKDNFSRDWIWIGIFAVIFGLLPSIISNRVVYFEDRFDRYTLPATIGVGLLIVGFISAFLTPKLRPWAIAFLVGLAVIMHFNNALIMRDFWNIQKEAWWQLSWRAPSLENGTLLLVNLPSGDSFPGGYEAWAPANLIYYRQPGPPPITGGGLKRLTPFEIYRGQEKQRLLRGVYVNSNFNKPLILSMADSSACLNVFDGKKYEVSETEDPLVQLVAPYSKIDQIRIDAPFSNPPEQIFGKEPAHTWCYYYQKAMYARQIGDWQEIAKLGDEATQKGLGPQHRSEWMPFLEGYANTGRDKEARNLAAIIKTEFGPRNFICNQLVKTTPTYPGKYEYEKIVEILCGGD
jgi:hypothetical protein